MHRAPLSSTFDCRHGITTHWPRGAPAGSPTSLTAAQLMPYAHPGIALSSSLRLPCYLKFFFFEAGDLCSNAQKQVVGRTLS
jgi:hypothetical protein